MIRMARFCKVPDLQCFHCHMLLCRTLYDYVVEYKTVFYNALFHFINCKNYTRNAITLSMKTLVFLCSPLQGSHLYSFETAA